MDIPLQFQNPQYRFCLVLPKAKKAFEDAWSTTTNYPFDSPTLHNHLNRLGNYGIIGGFGNLLIIDFDDQNFQDEYLPLFPPTFMVLTGSGKHHLYYTCPDAYSTKIKDEQDNCLADIQYTGKQVVAPGSTHPNGNKYLPANNLPIANITFLQVQTIFGALMQKEKAKKKYEAIINNQRKQDAVTEAVRSSLTISKVLQDAGVDTSRNPTNCPWHSSKGGRCLHFDDRKGLFYCFHCEKGGDIFRFTEIHHRETFPYARQRLIQKVL